MIEHATLRTLNLSKVSFIILCFVIPYLWWVDEYQLFTYLYLTYIAVVFFESDHFNIRFLIAMVAVHELLTIITSNLIVTSTRSLFALPDFTTEIVLLTLTEALLAFVLAVAIIYRAKLVNLFKRKTNMGRQYRLIGMEWLLLLSFLALSALHIWYFIVSFGSMTAITDISSLYDFYDLREVSSHATIFNVVTIIIYMFQLFALQSYNYKSCRKEWFLTS